MWLVAVTNYQIMPDKRHPNLWFLCQPNFFYHLINELAEVNTVWFLVFWIPLVRLVPTFWILLSQLSGTSQESKKTIPFPTPGLIGIFLVFAWQSWKRRNLNVGSPVNNLVTCFVGPAVRTNIQFPTFLSAAFKKGNTGCGWSGKLDGSWFRSLRPAKKKRKRN